jgi:hypothetical protein
MATNHYDLIIIGKATFTPQIKAFKATSDGLTNHHDKLNQLRMALWLFVKPL